MPSKTGGSHKTGELALPSSTATFEKVGPASCLASKIEQPQDLGVRGEEALER